MQLDHTSPRVIKASRRPQCLDFLLDQRRMDFLLDQRRMRTVKRFLVLKLMTGKI
jgi:hypothetical protein